MCKKTSSPLFLQQCTQKQAAYMKWTLHTFSASTSMSKTILLGLNSTTIHKLHMILSSINIASVIKLINSASNAWIYLQHEKDLSSQQNFGLPATPLHFGGSEPLLKSKLPIPFFCWPLKPPKSTTSRNHSQCFGSHEPGSFCPSNSSWGQWHVYTNYDAMLKSNADHE